MEDVYRRVLDTGEAVVNLDGRSRAGATQDRATLARQLLPGQRRRRGDRGGRGRDRRHRARGGRALPIGRHGHHGRGSLRAGRRRARRLHELGGGEAARVDEDELRGKSMHEAIHFQHADGSPHSEQDCALLQVRELSSPSGWTTRRSRARTGRSARWPTRPRRCATDRRATASSSCSATSATSGRRRSAIQRELDTLTWVGRIRDAIDEDRLVLYSQPIVPLSGGAAQPGAAAADDRHRTARSSPPGASCRSPRSTG